MFNLIYYLMQQKVTAFSSYDGIKYLVFKKTEDFHEFLCGLLSDIGFEESEILKADRPFAEMLEDYMLLRKKDTKLHLFVTEKQVHFVIDSKNSDVIINKIKELSEFF